MHEVIAARDEKLRLNPRQPGQIRKRDASDDAPPSHSDEAITCSDAVDASYTTKDVFDELVRVSNQVSSVFGPQWQYVSVSNSLL